MNRSELLDEIVSMFDNSETIIIRYKENNKIVLVLTKKNKKIKRFCFDNILDPSSSILSKYLSFEGKWINLEMSDLPKNMDLFYIDKIN